jgi:MFS transporter, putative metabolite:H+ symporter
MRTWTRILLRAPPALDDAQLRLLAAVALALLFEEYDGAMLVSALKHIAHDLHMAEADLGLYLGLIRLGAVPAFFCVPLADRIGRRPVFIGSTTILGLVTFATAFAPSPIAFVVLQALTRTFFVTGTALAFVIVAEEFPAMHRGWGVGMLAALGSFGHGLSAILFAQIERLPFGWRALYVIGVIPVLCLPFFLSRIAETTRFKNHDSTRVASDGPFRLSGVLEPMRALFGTHPWRALGLAASGLFIAAATQPSLQFTGFYTLEKLGWRPSQYSTMFVVGGAVGIVGNVAAGRMGDRFGRKAVGFTLLGLFPLASFAFYRGSSWIVVAAWVPLVFCFMGGRVVLKALSAELFPTSFRSAAAGVYAVMEAMGAVAGLFFIYAFRTSDVGYLARVIPLIALLSLGSAAILLSFPETRRRELEDISA